MASVASVLGQSARRHVKENPACHSHKLSAKQSFEIHIVSPNHAKFVAFPENEPAAMQVKVRTLERGLSIDASPTAHSVRNGSPNAKSRREDLTSPDLRIVRFAVVSRVTVLALSVLSDWIIPDHNPDPSVERRLSTSPWLRAFTRWDAARFTTIALEGYKKEEDYAFMPVLPLTMSIGTRILGVVGGSSATVAVGLVITNCCFVLAAWLLCLRFARPWFFASHLPTSSSAVFIRRVPLLYVPLADFCCWSSIDLGREPCFSG